MNMPGFRAEASLYRGGGPFRQGPLPPSRGDAVVPAIPFCGNCDWILDNCMRNGWRPRAVCNACAVGNCYSGVEVPPQGVPYP
jgi:hypothetical protein